MFFDGNYNFSSDDVNDMCSKNLFQWFWNKSNASKLLNQCCRFFFWRLDWLIFWIIIFIMGWFFYPTIMFWWKVESKVPSLLIFYISNYTNLFMGGRSLFCYLSGQEFSMSSLVIIFTSDLCFLQVSSSTLWFCKLKCYF